MFYLVRRYVTDSGKLNNKEEEEMSKCILQDVAYKQACSGDVGTIADWAQHVMDATVRGWICLAVADGLVGGREEGAL